MSAPDYREVESMLFQGFLTKPVQFGEMVLLLKNINQRELDLLEQLSLHRDATRKQELRVAYYLALSTYRLDRKNMLRDREDRLEELCQMYLQFPPFLASELLNALDVLNRRASQQIRFLEAYCYGPSSRQHWSMYKGQLLCDPRVTLIQGTEHLGINNHQSLWTLYNRRLDEEDAERKAFNRALFITSPHSADVKKIRQRSEDQLRDELEYRKSLYLGKGKRGSSGAMVERVSARSEDELMRQMQQIVAGEKDFHDMVVEEHVRMIEEEARKRLQDRLELQEEARRARAVQEETELDRPILLGLSPEQVREQVLANTRKKLELMEAREAEMNRRKKPG